MFSLFKRKTLQTPDTVHQVLRSRIGMIRPERMNRVFSPDRSTLAIRTPHRSILEYNQHLKHLVDGIKGPGVLNDFLFRNMPSYVLLRDWYVFENHYLNTEEHTKVFKQRSDELIELYIALETSTTPEHKRIVQQVSPVITTLREIIEQLVEVSKFDVPENLFRDPRS